MANYNKALFEYLIRLGDDHFFLGHRLSEWCGHAPMLEEDLALSNMALDFIGQARNLYTYAGEIEGRGRDEDALAYLRQQHEYHNLMLVEQPNGDFAHTMVRQLFFSTHALLLWGELVKCSDETLAQIAAKAVKESSYHVRHCGEWVIRLGDGTDESARRVADAVGTMAPLVGEMFARDSVVLELVKTGIAPDPDDLINPWRDKISAIFRQAKIDAEFSKITSASGGRQGAHSEAMGHILAQVQYMQKTYPGCQW